MVHGGPILCLAASRSMRTITGTVRRTRRAFRWITFAGTSARERAIKTKQAEYLKSARRDNAARVKCRSSWFVRRWNAGRAPTTDLGSGESLCIADWTRSILPGRGSHRWHHRYNSGIGARTAERCRLLPARDSHSRASRNLVAFSSITCQTWRWPKMCVNWTWSLAATPGWGAPIQDRQRTSCRELCAEECVGDQAANSE